MKVRKFALALGGAAVLFAVAAPAVNAQIILGPNGDGGWNAYQKSGSASFFDANEAAGGSSFPGISIGGTTIVPGSNLKGHLPTIPNAAVNLWVHDNLGTGWLGLSDNDDTIDAYIDAGAYEAGNTSANPYPAPGNTPEFGERGEGWVWADGSPLVYQNWNGGEPNDYNGAEDAAEMIGGGAWNDLGAGSATGQGNDQRPYSIEYDLNLAEHPLDLDLHMQIKGNGLLEGRAVAVVKNGGANVTETVKWGVSEIISVPIPGGGVSGEGSLNEVYLTGFWPTASFWKTLPALGDVAPPGTPAPNAVWIGLASWSNGTPPYPPEMLAIPGLAANQENYGARASGEIYLKAGDYRFRDGDDDYTLLVVNGQTLIDDTAWTGWTGIDNNFSGVPVGSEIVLTIDQDGWYPFMHAFGEGGGGDNFRLMWDRELGKNEAGQDVPSPDPEQDLAGELFYTVPTGVMRATIPEFSRVALALSVDAGGDVIGMGGINGFGAAGGMVDIPNSRNFADNQDHDLRLTASVLGLTETFDFHIDPTAPGGEIDPFVLLGDLNQDGQIGLADFNILKANFGASNGSAAVPEPSTLVLLGLGGLVGLVSYLRRRK